MYIKFSLYLFFLINLPSSLCGNHENSLQNDTCFLLSSKTSKIVFKPIEVKSTSNSYLFNLIVQKNSTGEVGVISIQKLFQNNKPIWYNISIVRNEEDITLEYSSNTTLNKINLPASQTRDIQLFIEVDLINKYFNGYTYSKNNQKIHEVNIKIKCPTSGNNLSNIYVSLGSFDKFENGFIGEVDFKYIKVDGKKYFLPSDKTFSGDIAIEERCTQLEEIKNQKSMIGICTFSEKKQCLNGGSCQINELGEPECLCQEGDYTGKYCQFSLVPKLCSHIPSSGIQKIDVDGSDIGEMGYVKCDNGKTIISHNFPPNMTIRSKNITQNLSYNINYKLMSYIQVRNLIQRSQKCQQNVSYSCYGNAPLNFKEGYTSFESILYDGLKPSYQLGDNSEFECDCKKNNKCSKTNINCNCDMNDNGINTDTGIFNNKISVGVRIINVLALPTIINIERGLGLLNISELSCYGDIGYENDFTVSFISTNGNLWFYRPIARRIEFEFRLLNDIRNFDVLEINDKEIFIHLFVKNKKELNFIIKNKTNIIDEKKLYHPMVLDNGDWHRIILELNRHEFRISIDNSYQIINNIDTISKIEQLLGKNLEVKLQNIIGCIRAFYIDDVVVNLSHELSMTNNEDVVTGCSALCQKDTCQNGGKCIGNVKEKTYKCVCKDKNLYYGDHCQFSINENTDISFNNPYESYIGYDSKKSLKTIESIYQNITMSFKTDQRKALLIFAMDEVNNFIQIHLSDEFRIILSMNYGNISKQCTVNTPKGTYFNNMEWKQIQLKHFKNNVTLFVDNESCTIIGSIPLTKNYVVLDEADDEIVIPPILPGQTNILPYKVLYVGGVPKPKESGDLITWSTIYNTKLPSILGCIRGLKFSSKFLDLRTSDLISSNKDSIRMKCQYDSCNNLNCQNKGHCSVRWFQPHPKETFCDCSKTSFYGPTCEDDDTIKFFKFPQQFSFDMSKIRKRYDLFDSKTQTFKFAFSTDKESIKPNKQLLSSIQMDNASENIVITLKSAEEVFIYMNNQIIPFKGNFTDSYRHFFQLILDHRKHKIWIIVDDDKKLINQTKIPYNLAKARKFIFGILDNNNKNNQYNDFISNVDINYHKSDHVHFMPLKYYKDSGHEYYDCINVQLNNDSSLLVDYKSSFKPEEVPVQKEENSLEFPSWDIPLAVRLIKEPLNYSSTSFESGDNNELNYTILFIAIGILLIILILFLIIGLCVSSKRGRKRRSIPIIKHLHDSSSKNTYVPMAEQLSPLNTTTLSYYPDKDDYTLPEPQVDTDPLEQIPKLEKLPYFYSTSTQLYFTAQESLSSDVESEKQNSEENNDDDDPLIKLTDYEEGRNSMIYIN